MAAAIARLLVRGDRHGPPGGPGGRRGVPETGPGAGRVTPFPANRGFVSRGFPSRSSLPHGAPSWKPTRLVDPGDHRGLDRWWRGALGLGGPTRPGVRRPGSIGLFPRRLGPGGHAARHRLKEAPDDADALRLAARAMARKDRDQAAIATYSRLELRMMLAEDYFLLGRALSRSGQDELALKALEAARSADPDRPDTLDELRRSLSGTTVPRRPRRSPSGSSASPDGKPGGSCCWGPASRRKDPAGAARALRRAFELDPDGKAAAPHPVGPLRMLLVRSLLQSG